MAEAGILGLPVERMYRSSDPDELALLDAVRLEGARVLSEILTELSRKIVKEQADAEERGRRRKGKK